jgi:aryl-alcohol dehydrogenase-like predicted oxidoreductase
VIVNRPFDGGSLFGAKTRKPCRAGRPKSACASWAEAFLKWIAGHPAVTCAIPATSQLAHLQENVRAIAGPLPDAAMRKRIAEDYARV